MLSVANKERLNLIYRSVIFQAVMLGMIGFTQLGIKVSISALGGGGLANVSTSNAQSAILFAVMIPGAPLASILANRFGIQHSVFLGSISGIFISTALYENSRSGNQWYIYFGAFLSGITSSFYWSCESTIAILYPNDESRGLFLGLWRALTTCGSLISGAIAFSLNIHGKNTSSVTLNTYRALIAIQCTGPIFGALISPPEKLIKPNGKRLKTNVIKDVTIKERIMQYRTIIFRKEILCFLPLFFTLFWWKPFENNFIGKKFSTRVRGTNSFISSVLSLITNVALIAFYDCKWISKKTKTRYTWILGAVIKGAFYIFGLYNVKWVEKHVPKKHRIDFDDPYFKRTYIPLLLANIASEIMFNWMHWALSCFHFAPTEISLIAGYIRAFESCGQTISFSVITTHKDLFLNGIISCCMFYASLPFVSYAAWKYVDNNEITEYYEEDGAIGTSSSSSSNHDLEAVSDSADQKSLTECHTKNIEDPHGGVKNVLATEAIAGTRQFE